MMYLVSVRKQTARSEYTDYYVVNTQDRAMAIDQVIAHAGEFRSDMSAEPIPDVYKIAKSSRHGAYLP